MTKRLKSHWGLILFLLLTLPCFLKISSTAGGGHYEIFSQGALQLWNQTNPYDDHWGSGKWIYSPPTGYFFFSLFAFLPKALGAVLYMLLSYLMFLGGSLYFARYLGLSSKQQSLFYLLVANETIGALLNVRLELWIVGCTLASAALLVAGRRSSLSAGLLALTAVLKAQTLSIAGLWILQFARTRKQGAWILAFVGVCLSLLLAPFVIQGVDVAQLDYQNWQATLAPHLEGTYRDFQHIYRFIAQTLEIDLSLSQVNSIGLAAAAIFAALVLLSASRHSFQHTLVLGLALGSVFSTTFSPMSQSAGYILWAPLLAIGLMDRYLNIWVLGLAWFLTSGLSSDFVPRPVKLELLPFAFKSLGPLLIGAWITWKSFTTRLF